MKKILIPLFLVLIVAIGCKKHVETDCLQAKLIRVTCAGKVMQVLNNNSVGVDNWIDIYSNDSTARYDNVFSVSNSCHMPSEYKVGDVVYITIKKGSASDCIQCALYDAPPAIAYEVKTIANLPCNNEGSPKQ